jgi:hypothetical protein
MHISRRRWLSSSHPEATDRAIWLFLSAGLAMCLAAIALSDTESFQPVGYTVEFEELFLP